MKRTLPECIRKYTEHREYRKDTIGRFGSEIFCFSDMVLKAEREKNESRSEHEMLRWLQGRLPVPEIICAEKSGDMRYLLMTRARGKMLCDEAYLSSPRLLVHLLAEGLKMLWTVDISGCPSKRHLDYKLEQASLRVSEGLQFDHEPDTYGREEFENPEELLLWLKEHRPEEETVFSHGDYCLPNIFAEDNTISGFIDLGRAGTAICFLRNWEWPRTGRRFDTIYCWTNCFDKKGEQDMQHRGTVELETERLVLRRFTMHDAEAMFHKLGKG